MTPEETKAMADRIAANRKEEEAKKAPKKEVKAKAPKVKPTAKKVKAPAAKVPATSRVGAMHKHPTEMFAGPGTKKFKFKAERGEGECDVLGCKAKGLGKKRRCPKHKKEIRKVQLAENNKVWKARVKKGTAGHHAVYTRPGEKKPIATKFALKETDRALKAVAAEHTLVDGVGNFKEIIARTKKELRA